MGSPEVKQLSEHPSSQTIQTTPPLKEMPYANGSKEGVGKGRKISSAAIPHGSGQSEIQTAENQTEPLEAIELNLQPKKKSHPGTLGSSQNSSERSETKPKEVIPQSLSEPMAAIETVKVSVSENEGTKPKQKKKSGLAQSLLCGRASSNCKG
jgi:hypothetical protein